MGATEMPIRRYVKEGVFTPQALSAMSAALEAAMEIGLGGDEAKRGAVARFIIRLAREDGTLDAAELRDKAVAAEASHTSRLLRPLSPRTSSQAQNDRRLGAAQVHSPPMRSQGRGS
jgi:hypothetical protein